MKGFSTVCDKSDKDGFFASFSMNIGFRLVPIVAFILLMSSGINAQSNSLNTKKLDRNLVRSLIQSQSKAVSQVKLENTDHTPSERNCATVEYNEWLKNKFGDIESVEEFESFLNSAMKNRHDRILADDVYRIPVIVHVVHNGESIGSGANVTRQQIESQIEILNEDFRRKPGTLGFNDNPVGADTKIEFSLAIYDQQGNLLPEPGINRINGGREGWEVSDINENLKPSTQWDPKKYFNIWLVNFTGNSSGLLGYAQFPSLSNLPGLESNGGSAKTDGVVIGYKYFGRTGNVKAPYDKGRTATHEVGHWLGLRHIWGDGDCSVDDFCGDTPLAGKPNHSCETSNTCPEGANDMIENYMDYSEDACMNIFTECQKQRMRTVLELCPRRKELVSSVKDEPTNKPIAYFEVSQIDGCQGVVIQFTDKSKNNPTSWNWSFFVDGEEIASFTDKNPELQFNAAGLYDVQLTVTNNSGSDQVLYKNLITIITAGEAFIPYYDDMESDVALLGWIAYNPDDDRSWSFYEGASAFGEGDWCVRFDNYSDDTDPTGTVDAFISPTINMRDNPDLELNFDLAYTTYGFSYSDTLAVLATIDCGQNYYLLWYKGGENLITTTPIEDEFYPEPNEWRSEKVSLAQFNNNPNLHIAFVNLSGWGNSVFIDNISFFEGTKEAPVANFTTNQTYECTQEPVYFYDLTSNAPSSWKWTFEGATPSVSNEQNPVVVYNNPGTFDVKLEVSNTYGSNSIALESYVEIVPKPNVQANASPKKIKPGQDAVLSASGASVYFWSESRDITWIKGQTITVSPGVTTTYLVEGYSEFACIAYDTVTVEVESSSNVIEIDGENVYIFPNPVSSELTISMDLFMNMHCSIGLFNMLGEKLISSDNVILDSRGIKLDVGHLPPGIYSLIISGDGRLITKKFIKI